MHVSFLKMIFNILVLGFGPAHPAAHGVLGINVCIIMGRVSCVDFIIGLLARQTEKLLESRAPGKGLNYYERLDYVAIFNMELSYSKMIESLLNVSDVIY